MIIAGQLSSLHSSEEMLEPNSVSRYLGDLTRVIPLDILVTGW